MPLKSSEGLGKAPQCRSHPYRGDREANLPVIFNSKSGQAPWGHHEKPSCRHPTRARLRLEIDAGMLSLTLRRYGVGSAIRHGSPMAESRNCLSAFKRPPIRARSKKRSAGDHPDWEKPLQYGAVVLRGFSSLCREPALSTSQENRSLKSQTRGRISKTTLIDCVLGGQSPNGAIYSWPRRRSSTGISQAMDKHRSPKR